MILLYGSAIRRFVLGRVVMVLLGVLLSSSLFWWFSCQPDSKKVAGTVTLAEPIRGYEVPPNWSVTLPNAPDVKKRLEPGQSVPVEILSPRSRKAQEALEDETGVDLDQNRIVARKDLPRAPGGGTVTVTVPKEGGKAEVTIVAREESWREWDPEWEVGLAAAQELGLESDWGPLGWALWSPGRVWKIRPVVGGMLGEQICERGCVMAGFVARF